MTGIFLLLDMLTCFVYTQDSGGVVGSLNCPELTLNNVEPEKVGLM